MKTTSNVIVKIERETINRGTKEFIISRCKNGYLAHELGKLLEICTVIGGNERYAHRLNKMTRYGNQYVRSRKPKPFTTIEQAMNAIIDNADTKISYF